MAMFAKRFAGTLCFASKLCTRTTFRPIFSTDSPTFHHYCFTNEQLPVFQKWRSRRSSGKYRFHNILLGENEAQRKFGSAAQIAIIDEGGDVDQIEVDVTVTTGSAQKKSSPRVKRINEHSADTDEDSTVTVNTTIEPQSNQEKQRQSNDNNQSEVTDGESTTKNNSSEQQIQEKENNQTESNNAALDNPLEELAPEKEISVNVVHAVSPKGIGEPIEEREEGLVVQDEVSENDEQNVCESAKNDEDSQLPVSSDVENIPDAHASDAYDKIENIGEDAHVENPLASEDEQPAQHDENVESGELQDSEMQEVVDDEVTTPDDGTNMAMEDDVLDMLDYDIEMPDQAQVDNDGENVESKTSDEAGNKDSSVASESSKDGDHEKGMKNLWITGLAASTRASELKVAFSRYGKVVGAKVVTNARSPGSKCYGFVAMATNEAAKKCIVHLHKTDLHGRMITVEFTKNDPSAKRGGRDRGDVKDRSGDKASDGKDASSSRRSGSNKEGANADSKRMSVESSGKLRRHDDDARSGEKRVRRSPERARGGARVLSRRAGDRRPETGEPYRKRPRPIGERKVVIDNQRGEMSLRVNVRSSQEGRRPNVLRRVGHSPPRTVRPARPDERLRRPFGRTFAHDHARTRERDLRDREVRTRELRARDAREEISRRKATNQRPSRSMALQASIERDRLLLKKEKEERNFLRMEREKLERERRQFERDRMERERLEHERLKLEQERKRELEKIEREKEEMKRLQDINRFEQSQRQRALKRMYDGRTHDDRSEGKRADRDDRRRYEGETRDRHAGPSEAFYRNEDSAYRPRGNTTARIEGGGRIEKVDYHDVDRRNMSHNDTDARYSGGRRVEKYDRPGAKGADYPSERRGTEVSGNLPYRHHEKDVGDDRKVVSRDRGRPPSGYRRDELPKKDAMPSMRRSAGRPRTADRDLREEINQAPLQSARKASPHRSELRHRDEPPSGRAIPRGTAEPPPKYPERSHPEPAMHGGAVMQSGPPSGKPIPTTGRSGISYQPSSAWPTWQGSNPIPTGGGPVGRMVAPMGLPFSPMPAVNPPPQMGDVLGHGIPATFAQSRPRRPF